MRLGVNAFGGKKIHTCGKVIEAAHLFERPNNKPPTSPNGVRTLTRENFQIPSAQLATREGIFNLAA